MINAITRDELDFDDHGRPYHCRQVLLLAGDHYHCICGRAVLATLAHAESANRGANRTDLRRADG
ncbi:hypothetical protein [Kitasatospora sp. A2-31]|uniref:hypothetical protein n=1 Tax=Kitasatospora sp. A2-31 TaxID=2916414 RepID=UPI001EEF551B|nr:hypothetical protein [Kitasatospora sp. A2-31]MCG6499447.1 hypothetical protein [Kitasatospora sp. A2-31]